jgi:hypothetical protein
MASQLESHWQLGLTVFTWSASPHPPLFMAKLNPSTQTGSGTTMSKLGMADLGFATLNDMVGNAGMIASLDRSVPLIADADTGYGGK